MPIGYALIGAGAFGTFCLNQYKQLDGLKLIAVCDSRAESADTLARSFGLKSYTTVEDLLLDDEVELVHLATPPVTHGEIGLKVLRAGRHLLCEKPLAIDADAGLAMIHAARDGDLMLAVNLIMRYDPINTIVGKIIESNVLGRPISGSLLNLASDHKLPPEHWFWDPHASGGIFVEHSVHFFDLFEMWFGPGLVRSAEQSARPGTNGKIIEQVRCVTEYGEGVLIDQYHGFHQAEPMDRQELRLIFEKGDILLRGWLALSIEIDALLAADDAQQLQQMMEELPVTVEREAVEGGVFKARHKLIEADGRYRITASLPDPKPQVYGRVLRDLMADQLAYIADRSHVRRVTDANGLSSLTIAQSANRRALAEGNIGA